MAAQTSEVTDLNFIRIISLFSEIGKYCLIKAFYSFVQKGNVQTYFQSDKIKNKIDDLWKREILVGDQYDKLKDENIRPDEFDLSLLFLLLRYVVEEVPAPVKGWHSLPAVGDNSLGVCLLKVQGIRNEVVHKPNVELGEDEFEEKWDYLAHYLRAIIESVCGREDSKKVSKRIRELKNTSKEDLSQNLTQNVDQVLLWSASDFSRLQSKLAEGQIRSNSETRQSRKDGLDEPDAVRSDYATLQRDLENITNELQAVSVDVKANFSPSSTSTDSSLVVEKLNDMTRKVNDIYTWVQELMLRPHAQAAQQVPMSRQGGGDFHENREVNQRSRSFNQNAMSDKDNPYAMSDKDIKTFSRYIGREFHHLVLVLNFKQPQNDMLVRSFQGISEQIFRLVKAWHDVVVDCDENPKELLAAALIEIENRLLAVTYFGERFARGRDFHHLALVLNFEQRQFDMLVKSLQGISDQTFRLVKAWHDVVVGCDENPKELLASALLEIENKYLAVTNFGEQFANDAEGKEPKQETIEKIQEIDFGAVISYGASASGSKDVPDSSAATSGQFKKRDDDTMTQTMVNCFARHMMCVAALIIGGQVVGTAFRVGERFLMTAAHVVVAIVDPDKKKRYCYRNLTWVKINFNDSPIDPDISNYTLKEWLYVDEPHDVAILEIANPDTRLPPRMFLRKEYVDRSLLNAVQIIGYGHPKCNRKRLDPNCKVVPPDGQEMVRAKEWLETQKGNYKMHLSYQGKDPTVVDQGYKPYDAPFVLLFHCFMEHGASGAPIVRVCQHAANTAASVEVIGVVSRGLPAFYFDLSNIPQSGFPNENRFEVGSRMSHIFETLEKKDRDMAAHLFYLPHPEPMDI